MVPSWVAPAGGNVAAPAGEGAGASGADDSSHPQGQAAQAQKPGGPTAIPIAPAGRLGGARRGLGSFAKSGDAKAMRRGLGQYVRGGYGGSGVAVQRFERTATTARTLLGALTSRTSSTAAADYAPINPAALAGKSAQEVMDAIINAVRPVDGTQDAEANRAAIRDALSDLLATYPDADLLNLQEEEREFTIERFVAMDVYRRIDLDVGAHVREKALSTVSALARLKEMRDYVRESVSAAFRKLRATGQIITNTSVSAIVRAALRETFVVFEGYAE